MSARYAFRPLLYKWAHSRPDVSLATLLNQEKDQTGQLEIAIIAGSTTLKSAVLILRIRAITLQQTSNSQVKLSPRLVIFLNVQFSLILHEIFSKTNWFTNVYAKSLRKKNLEPNSQFKQVFELMTPPKQGVSTNIRKNFAETLQFKDLAIKKLFIFLLRAYFCEKNPELVPKVFL